MNFESFISFNKMGMPLRAFEFFTVYKANTSVAFNVKKLEDIFYEEKKDENTTRLILSQWCSLVESIDEHIGAITSEVNIPLIKSFSEDGLSYEELKNKGTFNIFLETFCIHYIEGILDNYELKENENFPEGFGKVFCKRLLVSKDFFYPKK